MNTKDKLLTLISVLVVIGLITMIIFIESIFPKPDVDINTENVQISDYNLNASLGTNTDAEIEIIEFSDFSCPYCAESANVVHQILIDYGDEVNFVFKHFPVHQETIPGAVASECARDQGRFIEYHYLLFQNKKFESDDLIDYAKELGLNLEEFEICLNDEKKLEKVQSDMNEGIKAGVKGTPTFFINGQMIEGYREYPIMKSLIEELR